MSPEAGIVFREVQQFRQPLLWLLLGGMTMFMLVIFGLGFLKLNAANNKLAWLLFIPPLIMIGVSLMMYTSRMVTEVGQDGLTVKFTPFHRSVQKIPLENLASHEVVKIQALREYGGWGIRYGKNSKAYLVSGEEGVRLTYAAGNNLFIGSQKPAELDCAIAMLKGGEQPAGNPRQ
ncbi:MAG: DUF6141 family protein [Kiritimatiellae bacterium]|nr:DUF6141 family protein [Kiritimatiellia bacterium]MDD5521989.1 DUF6141 family protein [Kiritimatiellia bacterium]